MDDFIVLNAVHMLYHNLALMVVFLVVLMSCFTH